MVIGTLFSLLDSALVEDPQCTQYAGATGSKHGVLEKHSFSFHASDEKKKKHIKSISDA